MISTPYGALVLDSNTKPEHSVFSSAWRMWLNALDMVLKNLSSSNASTYTTPLTGFSIVALPTTGKLVLTPAGILATGTVTMPSPAYEGMEWRMLTTQTITSLTLTPASGQTIMSAPTTLVAGAGIGYTYASATATWYRLY